MGGDILLHKSNLLHLKTGYPSGVMISWNKKTFGEKRWHVEYGFPDTGFTLSYQDFKNEHLGKNTTLYGHYNFYFLNRALLFRVGQGVAFASNPYNFENNFKNHAFGSKLLASTLLLLNFKKEAILGALGIQFGASVMHYSNGNTKAPNASVNVFSFNAGLTHTFEKEPPNFAVDYTLTKYTEPIKINIVLRGGINQSDVIRSDQYPFYVISIYGDKRLNYKSSIQFGGEVFLSTYLKEFIKHKAISFPENGINGDEDYKRGSIFFGHELVFGSLRFLTHAGYYVYQPFKTKDKVYLRTGLKRHFGTKWFGVFSVKAHGFSAEAIEFGIGMRF